MIRAELDLARLATQAGGPLRLEADGTIRAGGVSIAAADADDLHVEPDMAVVLRGRPHATSDDHHLGRDLADYDRAFGIDLDGQVA